MALGRVAEFTMQRHFDLWKVSLGWDFQSLMKSDGPQRGPQRELLSPSLFRSEGGHMPGGGGPRGTWIPACWSFVIYC